MVNEITIVGNVGNKKELKSVGTTTVIQFSVATSEYSKTAENNRRTLWHNVKAWGKQAEYVDKYLGVGDMVAIHGRINYDEYEKNGEKKFFTEIVASSVTTLKRSEKNQEPAKQDSFEYETQDKPQTTTPVLEDDSDLPF